MLDRRDLNADLALPLAISVSLSRINSSHACVCTFIDTLSESPGALIKIPGLADPTNQTLIQIARYRISEFIVYKLSRGFLYVLRFENLYVKYESCTRQH